jgi:glycosidase
MNKLKFHILFLILFLGWSYKNTSSETVTNDEVVSDVEIYNDIQRVEPPNWWTGFNSNALQLLVHHDNIGAATPSINSGGITISKVHKADSPNYLFLDLIINPNAKPGNYTIVFTFDDQTELKQTFTLNQRQKSGEDFIGFNSSDVMYLITPDRFANANPENDSVERMRETAVDRSNDYGRHGGDIEGITQHLDYIEKMGFTAIWPSPLLTNDMPQASYHGYAMTDFYQVDPRFGTLEDYRTLASEAKKRGIKLVMDQVANHCGSYHWWMQDLPFKDWVNFQEAYENEENLPISNHARTTNQDLYASESDKQMMAQGWFVSSMPDLNQQNPFLATYLIQNSIWWVETLELGGIRQDTYPYPDKQFMSVWAGAIMKEYPNFNIVGEEWSSNPLLIGYWQRDAKNKDGYKSNLKSTMDFAMKDQIIAALNEEESWGTGLVKLYEGLANDFHYASPEDLLIFGDNHDMDRIFTSLNEDITNTKMAMSYMLMLPRIPQIYYGTEILMQNTAKPGDHGLIRTDFPGGWQGDTVNAFTGEGLSDDAKDMQQFLSKVLNYRKQSKAIHQGKTIHFAPKDGIYVLFRIEGSEVVMHIINKNESPVELDLTRFKELQLEGKRFRNIIEGYSVEWKDTFKLDKKGSYIFSTRL